MGSVQLRVTNECSSANVGGSADDGKGTDVGVGTNKGDRGYQGEEARGGVPLERVLADVVDSLEARATRGVDLDGNVPAAEGRKGKRATRDDDVMGPNQHEEQLVAGGRLDIMATEVELNVKRPSIPVKNAADGNSSVNSDQLKSSRNVQVY